MPSARYASASAPPEPAAPRCPLTHQVPRQLVMAVRAAGQASRAFGGGCADAAVGLTSQRYFRPIMLSLPGDRVPGCRRGGEMISTPSSSPAVPVRPCVYKGHHRTSRPLFAIVTPAT
jgi:hypothetical protein